MSTTFRRTRSGLYVPPVAGGYDSVVLADSPLVYFTFDESAGTTLVDHSGNGRDAAAIGTPTLNGANGWTFNGTNQAAQIVTPTAWLPMGDSPYTAEFVAKPSSVSGAHDAIGWGSTGANAANGHEINGTNFSNFWIGSNVTTSGVTASTSAWWHYMATYDQATLTIYVNGVSRGSAARTAHNTAVGNLFVGKSASGNFFAGNIRRVAVYSTALSSTRVAAHFAAAPLT